MSGLVSVLQEDVEASGEEGDSVARQVLLLSLLMEVSFDVGPSKSPPLLLGCRKCPQHVQKWYASKHCCQQVWSSCSSPTHGLLL